MTHSTTQIDKLHKLVSSTNLKASLWKGKRIYLNKLGKDINAWIELDTPDTLDFDNAADGISIKVFSNCNQGRSWLINRAKQVKFNIMETLNQANIIADICDDWNAVELF